MTSFVHGEAATQAAIDAVRALFGRGGDLADIDEDTLEAAIDGMKIDGEFGPRRSRPSASTTASPRPV